MAKEIVDLLYQLSHVLSANLHRQPLSAAQWTALRYFERASSHSRTVSGLACFQSTTLGTTSQTVKFLEATGLLIREKSPHDGRSSVLSVTQNGRDILARDPFVGLAMEIDNLSKEKRAEFRGIVRHLLNFTGQDAQKPFGTCRDCSHALLRHTNGSRPAPLLHCKHLKRSIDVDDRGLLCQFFEAAY